MPGSGGRLRVIEHSGQAVDLHRSDTGQIRLIIGRRVGETGRRAEIGISPKEARVLAHALNMAALWSEGEDRTDEAFWPEEYWAEGTFPGDELREQSAS